MGGGQGWLLLTCLLRVCLPPCLYFKAPFTVLLVCAAQVDAVIAARSALELQLDLGDQVGARTVGPSLGCQGHPVTAVLVLAGGDSREQPGASYTPGDLLWAPLALPPQYHCHRRPGYKSQLVE